MTTCHQRLRTKK